MSDDAALGMAVAVIVAALGVWEIVRALDDYASEFRRRGRLRLIGGVGMLLFALVAAMFGRLVRSGVGVIVLGVVVLAVLAFATWVESEMEDEKKGTTDKPIR